MSYHHLTRDDQSELGALLRIGASNAEIARQLGVHRATLGRELSRNNSPTMSGYHARTARIQTSLRRRGANQRFRKITPSTFIERYCERALKCEYSPEQIAGKLQFVFGESLNCSETIYLWIYTQRPELKSWLPRRGTKYRRKRGTKQGRRLREQAGKRWIDDRLYIVNERGRLDDWEGDTVEGMAKNCWHGTLIERQSGYLVAKKFERATAENMLGMVTENLQDAHTLTFDNGTEMVYHEEMERRTGLVVYFAHPYHSWERGKNENTNGLLRRYFPKKTLFDQITQEDVDRVVRRINTRPRKRLGYMSPYTVYCSRVALRTRI